MDRDEATYMKRLESENAALRQTNKELIDGLEKCRWYLVLADPSEFEDKAQFIEQHEALKAKASLQIKDKG